MPGSLLGLLRGLASRDRDGFLDAFRWRLHLRLLLLSTALSTAFFLLNLAKGRWDETGLGALFTLGAWAWLRRHRQHNRHVVRAVLALFLAMGLHATFIQVPGAAHWALLAMMIMPIFGALLDGLLTGAVAALVAVLSAAGVLAQGAPPSLELIVAFTIPATICLFATSLGHSWLFHGLVDRQRESSDAVATAAAATESLARTLSRDVTEATAALKHDLARGLEGLGSAAELRRVLSHARSRLPEALPRGEVDPKGLLDDLRRSAHRFYLVLAMLAALLATAFVLWFGLQLWELAAMVATATAMLLWLARFDGAWHWRLDLFLLACLGSMAVDAWLSAEHPPAASLVFLPLLVFYAGMLGSVRRAAIVLAVGALILAFAGKVSLPLDHYPTVLMVLGLLCLAMLGIVAAVLPLYRGLLAQIDGDEQRLRQGLEAYRRMVSTLFHDLANPLAVLQGLASLPSALRSPDDLERAQRMVGRLQSISDQARFSADLQAALSPVSAAELAETLRDLFRERLRERGLVLDVRTSLDRVIRQGGSLLRDSILSALLGNAIRWSPLSGRIGFSLSAGEGGVFLRLSDDGPGFQASALRDLANGIAPAPQADADGAYGQGYSLLLARGYARDLGGRLTLSNRPEGGALAELWLPT